MPPARVATLPRRRRLENVDRNGGARRVFRERLGPLNRHDSRLAEATFDVLVGWERRPHARAPQLLGGAELMPRHEIVKGRHVRDGSAPPLEPVPTDVSPPLLVLLLGVAVALGRTAVACASGVGSPVDVDVAAAAGTRVGPAATTPAVSVVATA